MSSDACNRPVDRVDQLGVSLRLGFQPFAVTQQHAHLVLALDVEKLRDLVQRHAELAMEQDLLQAQQLRTPVIPVAVLADPGRLQQADLVIMVQRPDGYARNRCKLFDGQVLHLPLPHQREDRHMHPHEA